MANTPQSRRTFLRAIVLAVASLGMLWRYLTPRTVRQRSVAVRVPRADLPTGGALVYREERLALFAEGKTVHALSLVCTHLGCSVIVTPEGLSCPCHGSRFDSTGRVLHGPADRPLPRLKTAELGGMIEVYRL